jgi:hypothetical protein
MKQKDGLFWLLVIIAGATVLSGLTQLLAPRFILGLVGGPSADGVPYFFAIIGMFMAIFGLLLIQDLLAIVGSPRILLWTAVQKVGASVAVSIGVATHVFSLLALVIAGFDLVSGLLIFVYRRRVQSAAGSM